MPQKTIASGVRMWIRSDNFLPNTWNVYSSVSLQTTSPFLAFDHNDIVESGLIFLRNELNHELTSELLPRKFTLSQLQELNEIVLDQKLDKRNFRKRVISKGKLKETDEKQKGVSHKPARLYSFKNLN